MLKFKLFAFFFFCFVQYAFPQITVSVNEESLKDDSYCPNDSIIFKFDVDKDRNLTTLEIERGIGEYCNKKYVKFFIAKFDSIRRTVPFEARNVTMPADEDICQCHKGYYMEGKKWYRKRDYSSAIGFFDKSIASKIDYAKPYRYKGLCQIKMRVIEVGCESLKKAAELGSKAAKREYPEFCN